MKAGTSSLLLIAALSIGIYAGPINPAVNNGYNRGDGYSVDGEQILTRRDPRNVVDLDQIAQDFQNAQDNDPNAFIRPIKRAVNTGSMKVEPNTRAYEDAVDEAYGDLGNIKTEGKATTPGGPPIKRDKVKRMVAPYDSYEPVDDGPFFTFGDFE
ncbi:hypothetical protein KVT40_001607 [Elsinoe batatas]|uniref:Uncharacterized protein n=1 Tax=Elsinoe batatas TaxID=2601811 RepID=A0A8K0L8C2_9PEZI|nr:hypothetical protein KVT40_001607 [Elsinoe batatas]